MKPLGKLALLLVFLSATDAVAQEQCRLPSRIEANACPAQAREGSRGTKGDFDHYVLSFSWSPAFCETAAGKRSAMQCRDNRFGWVVHGLWPQYTDRRAGQLWPQYCTPVQPVPEAVLRHHLCASPDPRLMQCEWAKHGSCSDFADPAAYFAAIETLRARYSLPEPVPGQRPAAFESVVAAANAPLGVERRHLQALGDGRGGIRELRLCLDRRLDRPVACRD